MTNLFTTAEVAERLKITPSAVSRAVSRGRLKPTRKLPGTRGVMLFSAARITSYEKGRWQR